MKGFKHDIIHQNSSYDLTMADSGDGKTASAYQPSLETMDRMLATIYGQCIGDAIGLLTEFLSKDEAKMHYEKVAKKLEYRHKQILCDFHRSRWQEGDWTDDSDQMILIMRSLVDCGGKVDPVDFAKKLKTWIQSGFSELGDLVGLGLGLTTMNVTSRPEFLKDPHEVARFVWDKRDRNIAPNGAVMRTSIVGIHMYWTLDDVTKNARDFAKTTHHDPRCQASTVAVSVAIATMLQGKHKDEKGKFKVKDIIQDAYTYASTCLETDTEKKDLMFYLTCDDINDLKLDEANKIGYTYKSMGTGFWALKQDDFRKTITTIMMQGGDADSNACVGGALLGCKLGMSALPESWLTKLLHKDWLDNEIKKYFEMMKWEWNYQPKDK
ncbi:ADP-ribosylarginine hydrolase Tri1-like isoform X2 [Mytilus californianus]|uniref:ADP-ribosylarginine hydrolase Tri1-like isoform X2 n=1 Tax=Mytilus californianus TaxID=6549 RepID=UPI0022482A30|nr:ADP-ribosylarginine hydrolase Tri1-like isoform X2 [Mytilus californianus]